MNAHHSCAIHGPSPHFSCTNPLPPNSAQFRSENHSLYVDLNRRLDSYFLTYRHMMSFNVLSMLSDQTPRQLLRAHQCRVGRCVNHTHWVGMHRARVEDCRKEETGVFEPEIKHLRDTRNSGIIAKIGDVPGASLFDGGKGDSHRLQALTHPVDAENIFKWPIFTAFEGICLNFNLEAATHGSTCLLQVTNIGTVTAKVRTEGADENFLFWNVFK